MRYKRLLVILLIIAVLCVAVACNDDSDTQNPDNQTPGTQLPEGQNPSGNDNDQGNGETDGEPDGDAGEGEDEGGGNITTYESDGTFYYSSNAEGYTLTSAVNENLNVANIPETFNSKPVTEIGEEAFRLAPWLSDVTVPSTVKVIREQAFSLCRNLTSITFAEGSELVSIGDNAFRAAENLQAIVLPDSLLSVGADCFNEAEALANVTCSNVIRIGRDAFDNTAYIQKQYELPGIIVIGKTAYAYVEVDGGAANLDVYEGIESIADGAFEDNDTIVSVTISSTVSHIGEGAFAYCDNIQSIRVDAANASYYSQNNAVLQEVSGGIRLLRGVDAIPEGVTEIAAKAFSGSAKVVNVVMSDEITALGAEAFAECLNLTSVVLSDGLTALPGFVDTHLHGAADVEFSSGNEDLDAALEWEASRGVTAILPTTRSLPFDQIEAAVSNITRQMNAPSEAGAPPRARVCGFHAEGPFVNPLKKGAMDPKKIQPVDVAFCKRLAEGGALRIMSIAPELDNAGKAAKLLRGHGVSVSMAHTAADFDCARKAFHAGFDRMTHTFNAMEPLNHRSPNAVGFALGCDGIVCELICDLVHVAAGALLTVIKAKTPARVCMVSDSGKFAGLPDGEYTVDGRVRYVSNGRCTLADGTIAGSCVSLLEGVKNLYALGIPLEDISVMASKNPAEAAGLNAGVLEPGRLADIVLMDRNLDPVRTFIG